MARYEVAVNTPVSFSAGPGGDPFAAAEQTMIVFDGYRFVWHANGEDRKRGDPCWPTIVMANDPNDYTNEVYATNRLISVMSFAFDHPMTVETSVTTGFKNEFDPPLLRQPSPSLGTVVIPRPTALNTAEDRRLRLVIGLFREARSPIAPSTASSHTSTPWMQRSTATRQLVTTSSVQY
jgi:hypothetical protein